MTSPQYLGHLKTRDFRRHYPQKGVRHEALKVHGGADSLCTAPGRYRHIGGRGLSQDRDIANHVLRLEEEVVRAD